MLSSLRSRLWVSYSLIILVALGGMIGPVISSLSQSPLFYRQLVLPLRMAQSSLSNQINLETNLDVEQIKEIALEQSRIDGFRYLLLNRNGKILVDTGLGIFPPMPALDTPIVETGDDPISFNVRLDVDHKPWMYVIRPLNDSLYLMAGSRQPVIEIRSMLRDEIVQPMLKGAMIALFIAFALGMFMSSWMESPLKRLADGARQIESGSYPVLEKEGPREIQELAESFNQMSKRVQQTEESQRDFLANVSHELKTPLTSIQGFAQSILDGAASTPDELMQAANVIYDESSRMHRLVIDLLTLSRLEEGTAGLYAGPVNLSMIMEQLDEKMRPQIQAAGLKIIKNIKPDLVVMGDGDRLAQVFTNLVDNAIKFTPNGGTVSLTLEPDQNYILASVSDTGVGIPDMEEARIFERFYQVDKSRRGGPSRGIGLGLAIARQIILSHNGEIWAVSDQGKGSTFYVRLPLCMEKTTIKIRRNTSA
jgi:signal transduction histidine kinase